MNSDVPRSFIIDPYLVRALNVWNAPFKDNIELRIDSWEKGCTLNPSD